MTTPDESSHEPVRSWSPVERQRSAEADDVRHLYRLFLGRDAETAAVLANEGERLDALVETILGSTEFSIEREKLTAGGSLDQSRYPGSPDPELKHWILAKLPVSNDGHRAVAQAVGWRELLAGLLGDDEFQMLLFPRTRSQAGELADALRAAPNASPASDGVTAADVRNLYRLVLGREAEPEAVEANEGRPLQDLLEQLLGSTEFNIEREKLVLGGVVGESRFGGEPDDAMRAWAGSVLPLTSETGSEMERAGTWRALLLALITDPEFSASVSDRLRPGLSQLASALQVRRSDLRLPDLDEQVVGGQSMTLDAFRKLGESEGPALADNAPAAPTLPQSLKWFDEDTYLELHPGVATAVANGALSSGLEHYVLYGQREGRAVAPRRSTRELMKARLRRYQPASWEAYLRRRPEVRAAGIDPFDHYTRYGWQEGLAIQSAQQLAQGVGRIALQPVEQFTSVPVGAAGSVTGREIGVYVSSQGNLFMNKIAHDLVTALSAQGAEVSLLDETADMDARPDACIFVAPHEFFLTGAGKSWVRDDILTDAIMLNTEQVQTVWFEQTLPYLLVGRAVIDMYYHSARLLAEAGIPTTHWAPDPAMQPLELEPSDEDHPLLRTLGDLPPGGAAVDFEDRPIELGFFGAESEKRDLNLARLSGALAAHRSFICYRRFRAGPLNSKNGGETLVRLASYVATRSKITLNLHRDEFGAFEWFRIVRLGMCAGSLVVTDPCLPVPTFTPGEHFLQDEARNLPDMIEWLLSSPDGRREARRVRDNATRLLQTRAAEQPSAGRLAAFLGSVLGGSD